MANKKNTKNMMNTLTLNAVVSTMMDTLMDWEMSCAGGGRALEIETENFRTAAQWRELYFKAKEAEEFGLIFWTAAINYDFAKLVEFMQDNDDNNNWFDYARKWFAKIINVKHEGNTWWVVIDESEVFTAKANLKTKRATFKFSHRI